MKKILIFFLLYFSFYFPVDVLVQTIENNRFVIESISMENNRKTRSNVIMENLPFTIGDTLTETEIHEGIKQLQRIQFFNKVILQPRAGSEPGKLHLNISIKERYWPALRFKGGFSELSGWYITPASLNMDNIFGYGNYIDLNFTIGDRVSSINFNYMNPNIFNSDLDFYFKILVRGTEYLNYIDSQKYIQKVSQFGYFFGLRSKIKTLKPFLFGWNFYLSEPDSFFTHAKTKKKYYNLPQKLEMYSNVRAITATFSIYYNLDKRDQPFYPCHGWWIGTWFSHADKKIGSEINFTRLIFDIRKYQHITNNFVIASRLKLGGISAKAPFYEKFFLGGPNSLRGYRDRNLSPVGGGERLVQGAVELRFPLTTKNFPKHFLSGVIFVDGGANVLTSEEITKNSFKGSFGLGFRFNLPFIRLLRLDFAYPINGSSDERVVFSLGHTF